MKRIGVAIGGLALALTVSGSVQAQESVTARPVKFGFGLGASVPVGDLGDAADFGWHAQGMLQFSMAALPLGLRADVMYHSLGGAANGPDWRIVAGNINAMLMTGGVQARPYLIGGLGLYNSDVGAIAGGIDPESSTDFGLNIGGGVQFMLSGFNAFVEGRLHHIMGDNNSLQLIPLTFGMTF